jgi:hypothetical protein
MIHNIQIGQLVVIEGREYIVEQVEPRLKLRVADGTETRTIYFPDDAEFYE